MILRDLSNDERCALAWAIHQEDGPKAGWELFRDRNPDAIEYSLDSVKLYAKSGQFRDDLKTYRERVVDNVDAKPYVKRSERLDVLVQMLKMHLYYLKKATHPKARQSDSMTHRERTQTSAEVRSLIKEIAEQFLPFEATGDGVEAPFAQFRQEMQNFSPDIRALIFPPKPAPSLPIRKEPEPS